MPSLQDKIFWSVQPHLEQISDKISVIGAGVVGVAVAVTILGCSITKNLVLVDAFSEKVKGEVLDLMHGSLFLKHPRIAGGNDFSATEGSKLCIITSGVKQEPDDTKITLAQKNADIIVKLIPELIKYSPETMFLIVGNPCDVLTYVTWKASGLPHYRVMGAGTVIDSQRFKVLIARKFNVSPDNVHAYVIGEHGENSIPVWSSVNISGIRLKQANPQIGTETDPENWMGLHQEVIGAVEAIEQLKGHSNWGIAMSVASIAKAILTNKMSIHPVSVNGNGKYGIKDDIFLPLPAVLGTNGVCDILHMNLTPDELTALQDAAALLKSVQDAIIIRGADIDCKCRRCRT